MSFEQFDDYLESILNNGSESEHESILDPGAWIFDLLSQEIECGRKFQYPFFEVEQNGSTSQQNVIQIISIVGYSILIPSAVLLNISVLLAIFFMGKRQTTDYLIANLAIADLLTACTSMWMNMIRETATDYKLGEVGCKTDTFSLVIVTSVSVLTLTIIALERFCAICSLSYRFLKNMLKPKAVTVLAILIWVVSITMALPYALFKVLVTHEYVEYAIDENSTNIVRSSNKYCEESWIFIADKKQENDTCEDRVTKLYDFRDVYNTFMFGELFIFPLHVMIFSYLFIVVMLKRQQRRTRKLNAEIRHGRYINQATITMTAVSVCFMVCWGPAQIYMMKMHSDKQNARRTDVMNGTPSENKWLTFIVFFLGDLNSALNPILYGLMNKNVMKGLKVGLAKTRERCKQITSAIERTEVKKSQEKETKLARHYNRSSPFLSTSLSPVMRHAVKKSQEKPKRKTSRITKLSKVSNTESSSQSKSSKHVDGRTPKESNKAPVIKVQIVFSCEVPDTHTVNRRSIQDSWMLADDIRR